jgi:hypothetical protein
VMPKMVSARSAVPTFLPFVSLISTVAIASIS